MSHEHYRRFRIVTYGRQRQVRWKEQVCLWWVAGAEVPVKVVVAEVEGYRQRFYLVSSATELTGVEMVEGFAGRFRQEDVFRDLKQRLGWEECRGLDPGPDRADQPGPVGDAEPAAVGSVPVGGRRLQGLVVASALELEEGPAQCAGRGSRLLRRHGSEIRGLLAKWLGEEEGVLGNRRRERLGVRGEDRWPELGLVRRSGHFPRNRGEMRGRRPEETELAMNT